MTQLAVDQAGKLAFDQLLRLAVAGQVANTQVIPSFVRVDPANPATIVEGPWVETMYPPRWFVVRRADGPCRSFESPACNGPI